MMFRLALVACALSISLAGVSNATAADDFGDGVADTRDKVNRAIAMYSDVLVNTRDHNPWEVLHAIIGQGVNTQISRGGPGGEPVTAVGWLCFNGRCGGDSLLTWEQGRLAARKGPRVQGHHGQFLAIMAQVHVMPDYPLEYDGRRFAVLDLVESEKLGCRSGTELTFKLIGLSHYLLSDATWKSDDGADWSISRLIHEEIAQPILRTAPCGGTHRLMGLAYSIRRRTKEGLPIDGEFRRAEKYLNDYHAYAFRLQNADGSFSTSWFEGPGARPDLNRRLQTSGHILEWLAFSLPKEQLQEPQMVKAVDYLAGILIEGQGRRWEIGPLGHALHALRIYQTRVFPESSSDAGNDLALEPLDPLSAGS
ncbi:MAG: hypothetical protein HY000_19930 [Planctomycetes bacterium]|nr:hypothetical protein [Planctomycetota bacterium]